MALKYKANMQLPEKLLNTSVYAWIGGNVLSLLFQAEADIFLVHFKIYVGFVLLMVLLLLVLC